MDTPHLFFVVSLGSTQGRPLVPEVPTFVLAYAAFDAWQALASRHGIPPTSVVLERTSAWPSAFDVPGDLYELPHHGRAADLRLVRAMPKAKRGRPLR